MLRNTRGSAQRQPSIFQAERAERNKRERELSAEDKANAVVKAAAAASAAAAAAKTAVTTATAETDVTKAQAQEPPLKCPKQEPAPKASSVKGGKLVPFCKGRTLRSGKMGLVDVGRLAEPMSDCI